MNLDLSGKTALVCGSTRGLGYASAVELALLGATVVLMARNEKKLVATVGQLDNSKGQTHGYLVADFADPRIVQQAIEQFIETNPLVHILVNNTGGPAAGAALEANTEDFLKAFNSHLVCNHILAQSVVPGMKTAGYGRIINIISTSVKAPLVGLA